MKKLMQRLISTGADISTRKTLKSSLKIIGFEPDNIDRLYINIKNAIIRDDFKKIPNERKAVFLPQCLRITGKCKAVMTEDGYKCMKCSAHNECRIYAIKEKAESKGYKVFVVPGGSLVYKIIKNHKIKAVLGIACVKELVDALETLNIPTQTIELKRDGCVDTDVSLNRVFNAL